MKEFRDKRKIKRILYSKLSILLLIGIFFVVAKASFHLYQKEKSSRDNLEKAQNELSELAERQKMLLHEIERLSTPIGIEQEIREKFKVAKAGENMVIIVGDEIKEEPKEEKAGFFEKIRQKFRRLFE